MPFASNLLHSAFHISSAVQFVVGITNARPGHTVPIDIYFAPFFTRVAFLVSGIGPTNSSAAILSSERTHAENCR